MTCAAPERDTLTCVNTGSQSPPPLAISRGVVCVPNLVQRARRLRTDFKTFVCKDGQTRGFCRKRANMSKVCVPESRRRACVFYLYRGRDGVFLSAGSLFVAISEGGCNVRRVRKDHYNEWRFSVVLRARSSGVWRHSFWGE